MPWSNWPIPVPKGTHKYRVTVTGKKKAVKAGVAAAFTSVAGKAALKSAENELAKFMLVAPNTPAASGGKAVVVFTDPPPYFSSKRLVRQYDPQTLVLLDVFCRLYVDVKATG